MAISIDYSDRTPRYIINVPRADMLDVTTGPTETRQLNINDFRQALDDLNDDVTGIPFPDTHVHTAPLTVSGVTLARVVEVLDPYVIEFEDGTYNVNIVGGNSNISDRTIKNSVGVNTANSAGLQDPFALQAGAFGGEVAVDVTALVSGTTFPYGTRGQPVNNFTDALVICEARGLRTLRLLASMTIDSGNDFSHGYKFTGDNAFVVATVDANADVTGCEFNNLTITGTLDGATTLRECAILDLNYFNGYIFQCGLGGTITLGGPSTAVILQCFSLVAGGGVGQYPTIDCGGTMITPLAIRDFSGGLQLTNCVDQQADCSIDMSSGRIVGAASLTDGLFVLRGVGDLEDNSAGATFDVSKLVNLSTITDAADKSPRLDDLHAVQVRDMSSATVGSVQTYTADGGRVIEVDINTGQRTATGVTLP